MKIKTKSNLLIAILILATILGFSSLTIGSTRAESGFIKYVYPSGDLTGVTDTNNIQNAFDEASAAGSKSTVVLGEGMFYLRHAIIVGDFDGTFKGQGKGKTIIKNYFDEDNPFPKNPNYNFPVSAFFWFYLENKGIEKPANLEVSDMTLKVNGYTEYRFWGGWLRMEYSFWSVFKIDMYYEECQYETNFNRVEIIGEYITNPQGFYVPNLWSGISFWTFGPSTTIKDCYIENTVFPFEFGWEPRSNIKISDNTIKNSLAGIRFIANDHIKAEITFNTFLNSPGFWSYGDEGCLYLIHHNDITMPEDNLFAGVEAGGFWSYETSRYIVSHNKIHSEDSLFWGPICMEGVHNSIISHNTITGRGPAAIYLGIPIQTPGVPSNGLKVLKNDVENWEVVDYTGIQNPGVFKGVAPIWLGTGTSNYIVTAKNIEETVFDEGTNNRLIDLP